MRVIYSEKHYNWLVNANRWPSPMVLRKGMVGEVISVHEDGLVFVKWPERPALMLNRNEEPHRLLPFRLHFQDNLEILER